MADSDADHASDEPDRESAGKAPARRVMEMDCARCGAPVAFDLSKLPDHFPFCSMRCKTLDFGDWIEPREDDEDEDSGDDAEA